MGFLGPEQAVLKDLKVETDARSNIKAEFEKYTTSIKGVSPPATAAAAKASSSGPSMKAAAPPGSATAI